jgi:hypothetical protein
MTQERKNKINEKKNNMHIFLKVNYNKQLKMKKFIDDFNIMLNKLKLNLYHSKNNLLNDRNYDI